jgi:hypothetical protein
VDCALVVATAVREGLAHGQTSEIDWDMRINGNVAAYWASVALGALTIVLVVANFFVLSSNQSIQAEANQRQQFINQSAQLKRVDDLLIRAIAQASVNAKDDKLRDLLAQQGVTLTAPTSEPASAPGGVGGAAGPDAAAPAAPAAAAAPPAVAPAGKAP